MEPMNHEQGPIESRTREQQEARDITAATSERAAPIHTEKRIITVVRSQAPRREVYKKPWHSQGWVWLIVAVAATAVLWFGLSTLAQHLGHLDQSVQEQTGVLREQNGLLASVRDYAGQLVQAVENGFARLIDAIRDAAASR